MAILPNPEEQARVAPRASTNISTYNPGNYGKTLQAEGDQLLEMAAAEGRRLDDLKATDAETQLMRREIELHAEYSTAKNDGVLATDYHKRSQDQYASAVEGIKSTLSTPAQQARFKAIANRRAVSFDASRVAYAMGEADRYQGVVYENRQQVLSDKAILSFKKPEEVAMALKEKNDEFAKEMIRQGINDPAVLTAKHKEMEGNFYAGIIQRALDNDATDVANAYFAGAAEKLDGKQYAHFKNQLDVGNDYNHAQSVADGALAMEQMGASAEDVELYVRKSTTNAQQNNLAHSFLRQASEARKEELQEKIGGLVYEFSQKGANNKTMLALQKSPAYRQLAPQERIEVDKAMRQEVDYAETKNWTRESRSRTRAEWARADAARAQENIYNSHAAMAEVNELIESGKVSTMTEQQIASRASKLGLKNVGTLLGYKKKLTPTYEGVKQIDADIVNGAIAHFKLDKDEASAMKGYVATMTSAWAEAHPGQKPTIAQQNAIVNSAMERFHTATPKAFGLYTSVDEATYAGYIPADKPRMKQAQDVLRHYVALGRPRPKPEELDYLMRTMEAINKDPLTKDLPILEKQRIIEDNLRYDKDRAPEKQFKLSE